MKFFTSTEDLKKQYRNLCKKLHPDFGGCEETFKAMLNEYQDLIVKGFNNSYKAENNDQNLTETMEQILKDLVHIDTIDIELVGSWLWLSGNTYECKDLLKEKGFKWNGKRKKWYYTEDEKKKYYNNKYSFEDIKRTYGSATIKKSVSRTALG